MLCLDLTVKVQQLLAFLLPAEVPHNAGAVHRRAYEVLVAGTPTQTIDGVVVALQACQFQIVLENGRLDH